MIQKSMLAIFIVSLVFMSTVALATPAADYTEDSFAIREWLKKFVNINDFADITQNCLMNSGQLSARNVSGKMSLISPIDYKINGIIYHKDATEDFWDLTNELDLPAGLPCYLLVLFTINADGTASYITPATFASTTALALAKLGTKDGLNYPNDQVVVGYTIVGNEGVGHDWDAVDLVDRGGAADHAVVYDGYPQSQRIVSQRDD